MGSWVFDENASGTQDEFLDNVIKHIDFPSEDVEGSTSLEDWGASFQLLELPSSDILEGLQSNFGEKIFDNKSESPPSPFNCDEKPKITGLPNSAQTASSGKLRHHRASCSGNANLFCSSGSVSVLESSGSCSRENSPGLGSRFFIPVKRARSKRLRPGALNPRISVPFISITRAASNTASPACSTIHFEMKATGLGKTKDEEMDPSLLQAKIECFPTSDQSSVRRCTHCAVTSTPQWREGPLGPKTLCNACGVRYRSGRLFPEYRPAASPTFVAALHSNSHKKVVEMRKKANLEVRIASRESLRLNPHRNLNRCLPT
ncbi:hypothetical protein MLD38_040163 [Melastoma candidum]|uniref:Uncharacterized protein n=1 Tax=Melastoma candidum TaxID=119954 RepID=A0ACB9L5M1_9MYRT|nr:hypothetical protein MLD38_040163 [Melastoma candidum]